MKLLFSEAQPDYSHYVFPFAVWAFPEPGETPADLFRAGFLPSSHRLDRFYLCRHLRVPLRRFAPSSENRRILRKGTDLEIKLVPRAEYDFTPERREFCRHYVRARFGATGLSDERLDSLFSSPVTTHVLTVTDAATNTEIGLATLYLEPPEMAFYYYAFYDLSRPDRHLGMFLMTSAVLHLAALPCEFLYVGTCYSDAARYKTQFDGIEFFDGFRWTENLAELKYLLHRGQRENHEHLLEDAAFRDEFAASDLGAFAATSPFRARSTDAPKPHPRP